MNPRRTAVPGRPSRLSAAAVAALASVALLAACGGDDEARPAANPSPTATTPAPPAPAAVDPLTGAAPASSAPLVAVKVDNGPLARPYHRGLEGAAVVYQELVEGGATRLLALYSQPFDSEVGPIRSFRESDMELLAQFGRPAVAFSGANDAVLRAFRDAVGAGQFADASYDTHPGAYRLAERRRDARNFFAVPTRLGSVAAGASPAHDVGWQFAEAAPAGAAPGTTGRVVFSDRETVELRYDPGTMRYTVLHGGTPVPGAAPANVVVQQVPVEASRHRDVTGAVTPYTVTVGTGVVDVLRDGVRVTGQWNRPDQASGTRLVDGAGADIALKPGPTWVMLQPAGLPLSIS